MLRISKDWLETKLSPFFSLKFGFQVFLLCLALRASLRLYYQFDLSVWFPGLDLETLPSFHSPIEFWSLGFSSFYYLLFLALLLLIGLQRLSPRWGLVVIGFMVFYGAEGGAAVGKAFIVLTPLFLFFWIMSFKTNFFNQSLPDEFALAGWFFLACMYGFNGLSKLQTPWLSGDALELVLGSNLWGPGWIVPEILKPTLKFFTWFVLFWELLGFTLVFGLKRYRQIYFVIACIFHLTLALISPLSVLGLSILSIWLVLLSRSDLKLSIWFKLKSNQKWFLALWVGWFFASNIPYHLGIKIPQNVMLRLEYSHLVPQWRLFAKAPPKDNLRFKIIRNYQEEVLESGVARLSFIKSLFKEKWISKKTELFFCQNPINESLEIYRLDQEVWKPVHIKCSKY